MEHLTRFSPRLTAIQHCLEVEKLPRFYFNVIAQSIFRGQAKKYSEVQGISKRVALRLIDRMQSDSILTVEPQQLQPSAQCVKALFQLQSAQQTPSLQQPVPPAAKDLAIESVWMQFKESQHRSICISSQVGCSLKCNFCATGAVGFKKQLTSDEIVDQVLYFHKHQMPVDSVSFMGMGEALLNPRVFDALALLTEGYGISARKLNVSTVGIIPGIQKLTRLHPHVNLAFSLHSPFTEQRSVLVPANKMYPLDEVLKVLELHALQTKRKVFLAYLVLKGVNDSREHAQAVVELVLSMKKECQHLFHLNLLRYNPAHGVEQSYEQTLDEDMKRFKGYFKHSVLANHITVRQSFGVDIDAACGQLYQVAQPKVKRVARDV